MPLIGFLDPKSPGPSAHFVAAFRQGLEQSGYVEGRNVAIEFRWGDGRYDQLTAMAADLVRHRVAIIAAISPSAAQAAKSATPTIPIVFQIGSDPVGLGLVQSLNRPGGNLTGISRLATELSPKLLELLHQAAPNADRIALLLNSSDAEAQGKMAAAQVAARSLGLNELQVLNAATKIEIDAAFSDLTQRRADALMIGQDVFFNNQIEQFATLALRSRLPAIYSLREFAASGGLMSYGSSLADQYHLVGSYVGRILKGEKPADLPVQQARKFDLVINLKTAKTLGLNIPPTLLATADEVIE
jgi:putative ABC transport system substrate-binding protein